jgi:hypothetical protein
VAIRSSSDTIFIAFQEDLLLSESDEAYSRDVGFILNEAGCDRAALGCPVQLDLWLLIYPWQVLRVSC